jgi:1-acyl-sn-glycerol-3-phosphate acyltransferase
VWTLREARGEDAGQDPVEEGGVIEHVTRLRRQGPRSRRTVRLGFWYGLVIVILRPLLLVITRRDWRGAEQLPPSGSGFLVCVNHVSYADPFTFGHFLYENGYLPRFLAKESLFRVPFIRRIMVGAQQIPVYRETNPMEALGAAVAALEQGECVTIYPEATLTRDPKLWPMMGKTGAARLALSTGVPVIPVAQWGAQDILAPYGKLPRLLPRRSTHVWAGPPVDLSRFEGRELTTEVLREATDAILDDITRLLEKIREEPAPPVRWDPRTGGAPRFGNPNRRRADR